VDVPVVPDGPDARDLLGDELSKPEYAAAQPTLFDIISRAFLEWLQRLFTPGGALPADWLLVALVAAVVIGIIVAILVWGVPRINRRSSLPESLFGEDDQRSADELRRSAAAAAAAGDFTTAVVEQFRALARGLAERTIVMVSAGTTANEFARTAAESFPDLGRALSEAASDFDAVRYLERPGTSGQYENLRLIDHDLAHRTPASLRELDQPAHA